MKTVRYAFWVIVAVCLILIGLANRDIITVNALPQGLANLLGLSSQINLPIFVVIFLGFGGGLLVGFLWEWLREYKIRAESGRKSRELDALRREVIKLRGVTDSKGKADDVLALLEAPAR